MKKLLFLVGLLLSNICAASGVTNTKISSVLMGEAYGNVALIRISIKPSSPPARQTNPEYSYILDLSIDLGKSTLRLVLMAYTTQQNVLRDGSNTCTSVHSSEVENLRQIKIK